MIPQRKLLADLRAVAEKLGRAPSTAEYDGLGDHSSGTVARRFGSWRAGLRAAGVGPRDPWRDEGWLRERADARPGQAAARDGPGRGDAAMRAGDLAPGAAVFVAPAGSRAHLYRACHHLQGGAARLRAEMCNPDAVVCPRCAEEKSAHPDPHRGTAAWLEAASPEDLGLLPFGQR